MHTHSESYCNLHCKHLTGHSHQVKMTHFVLKWKFYVFYQTCCSLQYVAMHHRDGQFLSLLVIREKFQYFSLSILFLVQMRTKRKLENFKTAKCMEWRTCCVCVWFILNIWKVQCMGDEYEDSYKCLSRIAEISCMVLYCIWIILCTFLYCICIFILYMKSIVGPSGRAV